MASGPITSWQADEKTVETGQDIAFYFASPGFWNHGQTEEYFSISKAPFQKPLFQGPAPT